jgi:hypothetical protein
MSPFDPKRHFATVNCRIAKGSFNHVVGDGKHVGSHLDAERSPRVQVDDKREFGRSRQSREKNIQPASILLIKAGPGGRHRRGSYLVRALG